MIGIGCPIGCPIGLKDCYPDGNSAAPHCRELPMTRYGNGGSK